jgi:hypothetical protein
MHKNPGHAADNPHPNPGLPSLPTATQLVGTRHVADGRGGYVFSSPRSEGRGALWAALGMRGRRRLAISFWTQPTFATGLGNAGMKGYDARGALLKAS